MNPKLGALRIRLNGVHRPSGARASVSISLKIVNSPCWPKITSHRTPNTYTRRYCIVRAFLIAAEKGISKRMAVGVWKGLDLAIQVHQVSCEHPAPGKLQTLAELWGRNHDFLLKASGIFGRLGAVCVRGVGWASSLNCHSSGFSRLCTKLCGTEPPGWDPNGDGDGMAAGQLYF